MGSDSGLWMIVGALLGLGVVIEYFHVGYMVACMRENSDAILAELRQIRQVLEPDSKTP